MAAARRGEWDKVCSCGFNGNLIGFCRHAATCVVVASRFSRIYTFLKPWSTVDAWHRQLVGKTELADMLLHTTVSWNEIVDLAKEMMARPGMAAIYIAWFKTRLTGRPKED
eukprot:4712005-Pleurochrysis_carterae.AAC.1